MERAERKAVRKNRIQIGSPVADVIIILVTMLICVVALYPMYYVFIMSVSDPRSVMAKDIFLVPKGFQLKSYKLLFDNRDMWTAYKNTLIYVGATTVLMLATCSIGAYPLTVDGLPGRKWVVRYLLVPMYFGGMIPTFLLMNRIGLYDNRMAIILPACVSIWYTILVHTFFRSIPNSLRESAFLDGATHLQVLTKIFLPLSKPIMAVIAIYTIVGMWNSWFSAQIYLPSRSLHPLQLYLQRVLIQKSVDLSTLNSTEIEEALEKMFSSQQMQYSIIIFTTLPVIFTYPFFQKYFIKGIMIGSLKG